MKTLTIIFSFFIFISCNSKEEKKTKVQDETTRKFNFDFLIGEWLRTNDTEGRATFEIWKKNNDSTYLGHGFTMREKDTIWQETVLLSTIKGEWYFQVKSLEDSVSIDFRLTDYENNSFVFENQQNEFPKVIKYRKNGKDKLHAEISADTIKIDFEFQKK